MARDKPTQHEGPYHQKGNVTRGERGTCNVWVQGLPTWAFVAQLEVFQITVIGSQVDRIRGWSTRLYTGLNIAVKLTMVW